MYFCSQSTNQLKLEHMLHLREWCILQCWDLLLCAHTYAKVCMKLCLYVSQYVCVYICVIMQRAHHLQLEDMFHLREWYFPTCVFIYLIQTLWQKRVLMRKRAQFMSLRMHSCMSVCLYIYLYLYGYKLYVHLYRYMWKSVIVPRVHLVNSLAFKTVTLCTL